jgi:CheY-like chemotaxis protein
MARCVTERPVVLIVEDEAMIRMNVIQVAEDAGYEVLEAANADEAIEILEGRNDICAVFTDVKMPGSMNGLKLACAIGGRWPSIRVVVMSALDVTSDSDFPVHGRFIRKPYQNSQIIAALQEVRSAQY